MSCHHGVRYGLLSEPVDVFRGRGQDRIERLALGLLAAELGEGDLGQGVGLSPKCYLPTHHSMV